MVFFKLPSFQCLFKLNRQVTAANLAQKLGKTDEALTHARRCIMIEPKSGTSGFRYKSVHFGQQMTEHPGWSCLGIYNKNLYTAAHREF